MLGSKSEKEKTVACSPYSPRSLIGNKRSNRKHLLWVTIFSTLSPLFQRTWGSIACSENDVHQPTDSISGETAWWPSRESCFSGESPWCWGSFSSKELQLWRILQYVWDNLAAWSDLLFPAHGWQEAQGKLGKIIQHPPSFNKGPFSFIM